MIQPQYIFATNFINDRAIVCKGEWNLTDSPKGKRYWCDQELWGVIDLHEKEIVPCRYDALYPIDQTDRYYLVHKGGWKLGNYCIYDVVSNSEILELDFAFDCGYMFNDCFLAEDDLLVFDEHLPGKGKDLISIYSLSQQKFLEHRAEYTEHTLNGKNIVIVNKDGEDFVVF